MKKLRKLSLGAGSIIRSDFVNLDFASLPGIDVIHDLNSYPWPFESDSMDHILAEDVLEHLDNPIKAIEEMHRISSSGGILEIQVPYWNSWSANTDLSHRHRFTEHSFDYFDPDTKLGKIRFYYSPAKVKKLAEEIVITPLLPWLPIPKFSHFVVKNKVMLKILFVLGGFFSNVVQDYRVTLKVLK